MNYIDSYFSGKERCCRKQMEDYYNIFFCSENQCWIFNVCDGHGGFEVAEYINKKFNIDFINLINKLKVEKEIKINVLKKKIEELVENLDKEIKLLPCSEFTGSTFACVIYYRNNIFFINIGDSNIICNMKPPYFNKLHVPNDTIEKTRITKKSYIIGERIEGMINLSRAFGDFRFKKSQKHISPMISTPDIDIFLIKDMFLFNNIPWILLSSDGLVIFFERNQLRKIINLYFELGFTCEYIVKLLMKYCCYYNNNDNIALILILLTDGNKNNKRKINDKEIKFLNDIKSEIYFYCMEIIKKYEDKNIGWKEVLEGIKKKILLKNKKVFYLSLIYNLLEFEIISNIKQIKL